MGKGVAQAHIGARVLTIRPSRRHFVARLNSGVRRSWPLALHRCLLPWVALVCVGAMVLGWNTGARLLLIALAAGSVLFWLQAHVRQRGWEGASPVAVATIGIGVFVAMLLMASTVALLWIGVTRGLHD